MDRRVLGFSLIEALVALVVVSIGLLGMAGLQTKAMSADQHSRSLSQATIAAHDMIERMRANPAALEQGGYNLPESVQHLGCFTTVGCSPAELAENDMYEWRSSNASSSLAKLLLDGSGTVCLDSTPDDGSMARNEALAVDGDDTTTANDPAECDGLGDVYAVKVWWLDIGSGTTQRYVTTVAFK
jgi:type IV pilus assembly protein PilV